MKEKNALEKNKIPAYITLIATTCFGILFFAVPLYNLILAYLIFLYFLTASIGAIIILTSKDEIYQKNMILSDKEIECILNSKKENLDIREIVYYGKYLIEERNNLNIPKDEDLGIVFYDVTNKEFHNVLMNCINEYQIKEDMKNDQNG